jgi:hypothetical protein
VDKRYQEFSDAHIRHLDMIQGVIARLGNDGFIVKGWSVTVAGAFLGFAITRENGWLAAAGILPTVLLWFLDASFLRSERAFRTLYSNAIDNKVEPFYMNATAPRYLESLGQRERANIAWRSVIRRPSLCLVHGSLVATSAIIAVAIGAWAHSSHCPMP